MALQVRLVGHRSVREGATKAASIPHRRGWVVGFVLSPVCEDSRVVFSPQRWCWWSRSPEPPEPGASHRLHSSTEIKICVPDMNL